MAFFQGLVSLGEMGRALRPGLGSLTSVLGGEPQHRAPLYLSWALTERCNLGCKHCSFGPATAEMNGDERIKVAHKLADSGTWGVSLIGGEPTLVSGLANYVGILSDRGIYTTLGTSGFRISRQLKDLLDAGLSNIVFSVDHHIAAEHDAFRGRPGLFEEVSEAIWQIYQFGQERASVQVRTTMHRGNFEEMPEIVRYWKGRVDNVVIQVVQNNELHEPPDRSVLFQPGDRPRLEAVIARLQDEHPVLRTHYFDYMADYVFDPEALRERIGFRCLVVPGATMLIMPNGDLRLCYGHEESSVGNVLHQDIDTVWRSGSTGCVRTYMQSSELGCMCWEQANSPNLDLCCATTPSRR